MTAAMARAATSEYIEALKARGDIKIAQDRM
jgi:peptidyl-prolyl cis-trans isomerase D